MQVAEMKVVAPATLDDALRLLKAEGEGARPLAGATDAMVRIKEGQWRVPLWIDIRRVTPLDRVTVEDGVIRIGAAVPYGRLLRSSVPAPLLMAAIRDIGSVQIRAMGTIGGNLGTASPAGDTIPALYALDAEVGLVSLTGGERWVPVEQFCLGPGRTVRKPDELILGVKFAAQSPDERWSWQKLGLRGAQAISIVSLATRVLPSRVAFGAVGPTVLRARKCEGLLTNGAPRSTVARMAWKEVAPISDVRASAEYRQEMACALLERALREVAYA